MNILSTIHTGLHPAALGFAPGIDWIATSASVGGIAVLGFAAGAIAGAMVGRRVPGCGAPHPPPAPELARLKTLTAQRKALLEGSVKVRGLLEDELLTNVLDDALRRSGVSVFEATGDPIDPERHRVAHTVAAPDADADGVIARTLTPGYADDGWIVRPADVVVYKWGGS